MRHRFPAWLAALALLALLLPVHAHGGYPRADAAASHRGPALPQATHDLALRIVQSSDHGRLPFAIVDKQAAMIMVYDQDGTFAGASTVLLGLTPGDESTAGVGQRTQAGKLEVADRTTPAGRFESLPGNNLAGEHVVWISYADALAIHRLRPAPAAERRVQRMASANPRDKRISAGCVVVPEAFYDDVIRPVLGHGRAVVYVLPEKSPWQQMWTGLAQLDL